jgi:hypothetical protein
LKQKGQDIMSINIFNPNPIPESALPDADSRIDGFSVTGGRLFGTHVGFKPDAH